MAQKDSAESTEYSGWKKEDPFLDADDTDAVLDAPLAAEEGRSAAASSHAGEEAPWSLLPLLVAFICCGFTAGIVPGQTLYVQFFAEAHVFQELCPPDSTGKYCDFQILHMTEIIGCFYVVMLGAQFACGGLFDAAGGRLCGALGSIVVALSYFGIAAMVALIQYFPEHVTICSYMVMLFVAVADIGAWLNNYALMGMIWHYPDRQKLVFALMNAAYQMGSIYALVAQRLMMNYSISLASFMAAWAVLQLVLTPLLWFSVPSLQSYHLQAEKVLRMPLPKKEKASWKNMITAYETLMLDWWPHTLLCVVLSWGNVFVFFYLSSLLPFGDSLFGELEAGSYLSTSSALINGLVSVAMAPVLGELGDRYGFGVYVNLQFILLIIFSCTVWVPIWAFTYIAGISAASYTSVNYMMSGAWFVNFSPPNRIGLVMGVWYLENSLIYVVTQVFVISWAMSLPAGANRYKIPMAFAGELAIFSSAFFIWTFYHSNPLPAKPRLLPEDDESMLLNQPGLTVGRYGKH